MSTLVDRPMMPMNGQKADIVAPKNNQPKENAIASNGPGPNEKKDYVGNAGGLLKPGEKVLQLATFFVPLNVTNSEPYIVLGKAMINTWKRDGIFQVGMDKRQQAIAAEAMEQNRQFVLRPLEEKLKFVSDLTYSGYVASKEETTGDMKDAAEIFTLTKDVPMEDARVGDEWPCHGPVCWPNENHKKAMKAYMDMLGELGESLLQLIALGLDLPIHTFTQLSADGWHHMRVLHFPDREEGQTVRGIGAHTDYGMLVLASQDEVGGLFIRPPIAGEWRPRNWLSTESAAGVYEHDDQWYFVPPCTGTLTCFAGDMFQYLTRGMLLSTPHKVRLNSRERFALAYFHEPNFNARIQPLPNLNGADCDWRKPVPDYIHYGTHFTNMFMRCYPDRITTKRIEAKGSLDKLRELREAGPEGGA